ncbi:glycerophosphodiester phosphodiesterase [Paenibacillus yanchengensis]|uniref:Glycerophosphodiester phosphodiesterase n=1 Tax=Paenibacillus yanchengensis TaxID=2035833 RepID=A0ABW4YPQ5_9BACL
MTLKKPLIIAHRGSSKVAPENTMAAFALGVNEGCQMIELDVHMTKDAQIVVCHDDTLDRTTNGKGDIATLHYSKIKQYDAGSWFHKKYAGQYVPLLEEVLHATPADIMFNVEIKHGKLPQINKRIVKVLQANNWINRVVISSFDYNYLIHIKKLVPEIQIGLLYDHSQFSFEVFEAQAGVEVYSLHPRYNLVTAAYMEKAKAADKKVFPWTVDSEKMWRKLISLEVDGIITNCPGKLQRMLMSSN